MPPLKKPLAKPALVNRTPVGTHKGKLINRSSGAHGTGGTGQGQRSGAKRFEGITPEIQAQFDASKKDNVQCDGKVVDVKTLKPDPLNARLHPDRNIVSIMQSLALFGQRKPLVVNERTMIVVAGNGTLEAAIALGWKNVAATIRPMSDDDARDYGLADNKTAELAKWDLSVVAQLEKLSAGEGSSRLVGWSASELIALRTAPQTAEELWTGMPEFVQEDQTEFYASVLVKFKTEVDEKGFYSLVGGKVRGVKIGDSMWFPVAEPGQYEGKRYVDASKKNGSK
jgi:hypothetical protein